MKKTRNSYKMYAAWEFDREVQNLEDYSRDGWQLIKGGCFHSKFSFDDTVQYRYALDFNRGVTDPVRYRETFAEQGWEYINSTFNGWHYFRKAYDPSLLEEEYQIYTDTASRQEMANRWRRIACILGGTELVLGIVLLGMNFLRPAIHSICCALGAVLLGLLLVLSGRWIGRSDRRRASARMLIPVFALFVTAMVFGSLRTGFITQTEYIAPEDSSAWQFSVDVKLPDIYTLDVSVGAPERVMIVMVKESSDEESSAGTYDTLPKYYTAEGSRIEQTVHLFLTPGTYSIYTQYQPDAEPGLAGQFKYKLN